MIVIVWELCLGFQLAALRAVKFLPPATYILSRPGCILLQYKNPLRYPSTSNPFQQAQFLIRPPHGVKSFSFLIVRAGEPPTVQLE